MWLLIKVFTVIYPNYLLEYNCSFLMHLRYVIYFTNHMVIFQRWSFEWWAYLPEIITSSPSAKNFRVTPFPRSTGFWPLQLSSSMLPYESLDCKWGVTIFNKSKLSIWIYNLKYFLRSTDGILVSVHVVSA